MCIFEYSKVQFVLKMTNLFTNQTTESMWIDGIPCQKVIFSAFLFRIYIYIYPQIYNFYIVETGLLRIVD